MSEVQVISAKDTEAKLDARRVRQVAQSNAALWAETFIRTESGEPFSFARHIYQVEPMAVCAPKEDVQKATQGGFTLATMLKLLHAMITGRIKQGAIYLFPTDIKVGEFSQLRWGPLIDNNPGEIGRFLQRTNNVHNKRVRNANLMMRGAQLSHGIQNLERESVALRSDPADVLVCDELDLMPPYAVAKGRGRLGHSELAWEWNLSNPTIPGYGIHKGFQDSDQRHWMVRCAGCNEWWCLEIEFPAILRRLADGRVIRACLRCGRELDIDKGQWVAKFPSRSADHIGRWWSQLNSHYVDPGLILQEFNDPPEGNVGDVKRLRLGMPHLDEQYGLTKDQVLLRCGTEPAAAASAASCAMGVDVGPKLHVVVGYRLTNDAYRVLALLLVDGWGELDQAARAFHAEVTSIDNEPEIHAARSYQAAGPGRIWLSDYVDSVLPAHYDAKTRVVSVNRTEILDTTHYYLTTPGRLVLPRVNTLVQLFAEHCSAMAKIVTKDARTGEAKSRYISKGPDHFRHAFANFLLAARQQVPVEYRGTHTQRAPRRSRFDLYT